jgi:hypothetical protein
MWHLMLQASNTAGDPDFEENARTFFMWMAILALVVTWAWLYLRIRGRMKQPQGPEPPTTPD